MASESLGGIYWTVDADTSGVVNSTKSFETQVNKTEKSLTGLDRQSKTTGNNVVKLKNQFTNFGRNAGAAVASVDGPMGGIASRISSLTTLMTTGGIATTTFAVAFAALAYAISDGVRELDKLNIANARAQALIDATGSSAGKTAQQLEAQAKSVALNTLASTEGVQSAQAVLLTFKAVQGDVFDRAINLSQDLADVMGTDIKSSALQMGKALQDPLTGLTALTRSGVSFTDQQKEMVKSLIESGQKLEAQSLILSEIESQYSGAAAAMAAGTLSGAIDTMGQSLDEMTTQLAINSGALEIFENLISRVAKGMRIFTSETLAPKTDTQDFERALDLLYEIAVEEEKLAKMQDGIVKASQQAKINGMKRERQELLKTSSEKAKINNAESLQAGQAAKQMQSIREKEAADAIARAEKTAKEIRSKQYNKDATRALSQAEAIIVQSSDKSIYDKKRDIIEQFYADGLLKAAKYQEALAAINSAEAADKKEQEAEQFAKDSELASTSAQGIISRGNTPEDERQIESDLLTEWRDAELISLAEFEAAKTQIEKEGQEERAEMLKANANLVLGASSDLFGSLASIISSSGDEQSAAYKAMFALSKGFAIAQAGLNLGLAISQASTLPFPTNIPAMASAAAAGASLVDQVSSAVYSGREHGGSVIGGQTYEMGEKNKPELLVIPGNNGKVLSNAEMKGLSGGGGGQLNQTINNYASNDGYEVRTRGDGVNTPQVLDIVRAEMGNSNSIGWRGMQNTSNLKNRSRSRR